MRGFFAGGAFMAMDVGDARDFDGTLEVVRTMWARALVDAAIETMFRAEEGAVAVESPVRSFRGAIMTRHLPPAAADFAARLAGGAAAVAVEEVAGGAAVGTTTGGGQGVSAGTLKGRQGATVLAWVRSPQLPPALAREGHRGRLGHWKEPGPAKRC